MPRDVTRRDHLRAGLTVKVVPEGAGASPSSVVEGAVAELLSGDDARGVLVRLEDGTLGRVLRVWEGGDARGDAPAGEAARGGALPSWNLERPPPPEHRRMRLDEREVERRASEELANAGRSEIDRLVDRSAEGLAAGALRRFSIDDDELARELREQVGELSEEDLARRLARAEPEDDEREDREDR